ALDESRAKLEEADTSARAAADEAGRLAQLRNDGLVAEVELVRARAAAEQKRAAADALRLALSRQNKDQRAADSTQQVALEGLKREAAVLEGELKTHRATIERLEHEIAERFIIAPATGKLGEVAELHAGQVVRAG